MIEVWFIAALFNHGMVYSPVEYSTKANCVFAATEYFARYKKPLFEDYPGPRSVHCQSFLKEKK